MSTLHGMNLSQEFLDGFIKVIVVAENKLLEIFLFVPVPEMMLNILSSLVSLLENGLVGVGNLYQGE